MSACYKCGADMIVSPKSGKLYCSAKCWLQQGGQQQGGYQQPPIQQYSQPADYPPQQQQKPNWDAINAEKVKDIRWGLAFKLAADTIRDSWDKIANDAESGTVVWKRACVLFARLEQRPNITGTHIRDPQRAAQEPPPPMEPPPQYDRSNPPDQSQGLAF